MTIVTCVAGFALAATLSTSLTALTCSVRRRTACRSLFVPRLKMDCGEVVRETVYMTDEDAGEYWRLSPDRHSALCLHSLRQVPVVWRSALVAECGPQYTHT